MAKPDTWKPLFRKKAPWGLNQWKLTWGYMWCLSKTKCKFISGVYWLHFRKTNSSNRPYGILYLLFRCDLWSQRGRRVVTIWYWQRIVIFASGFVNLFYLELSVKLCKRHLATKGVAHGISSSLLLTLVERAGWREWNDSLLSLFLIFQKKFIKDVNDDRSDLLRIDELKKALSTSILWNG